MSGFIWSNLLEGAELSKDFDCSKRVKLLHACNGDLDVHADD